jgi:hypothetical protein
MIHLLERCNLWFHVFAFESDIGALVSHLVAVVWSGEYGEALATLLIFVA